MRRLFAVVVVALVGALPAASPGASSPWKHLKYFLYEGQEILVTTDGSWTHAKVVPLVTKFQKPALPAPPWDKRVSRNYIWASTCSSGVQAVSMSRTFLAPGDPAKGGFLFQLGFGAPTYHSGVYLVNGIEIARIGEATSPTQRFSVDGALSPRELKAFHYGANTLTIRVEKAALKKGEGCNNPNRLIGVLADLHLTFKPDLEVVPSKKGREFAARAREQATRAAPGQAVGVFGTLEFANHGPSGSPGGKLVFQVFPDNGLETAIFPGPRGLQVSSPFHTCTGGGVGSVTITCKYSDFGAAKRPTINILNGAKVAANFPANGVTKLDLVWTLYPDGGTDRNAADNVYTHRFWICGTAATYPACKDAK